MFAWAQSTFDKLSEAVAPPPADGAGRYSYAVQRGDEDTAMRCIAEIDPVHTIVNQSKGLYPVHLACQYSLIRLVRLLLSQPGMMMDQTDSAGNTPLHHAAMSTSPAGLECVRLLIQEYHANVCVKNYQGQTPYDVATMNSIRQYLLPIQLQAETQIALDNGGEGLPPGIDLGGLRIKNSHMPPPPTSFSGGPPAATPPPPQFGFGTAPPQNFSGGPPPPQQSIPGGPPQPPQNSEGPPSATPQNSGTDMFGTPTPTGKIASAPASMPSNISGPHTYSRVGGSSAALSGVGKYRADGFHSSSSDIGLQKKYGHATVQRYVPPPPSSGNSIPSAPSSGGVGGPNPFAGGVTSIGSGARYGAIPARSRYVAYGPTASAPTPSSAYTAAYQTPTPPAMAPNFTMFVPGGGMAQPYGQQPQPQQAQQQQPYVQQPQQQQQYQQPSQYSQGQYQHSEVAEQTQPQQHQYPAPFQSTPQQAAPASAPPATPNTPFMPPPPYQMRNYNQSTPSTMQRPSFVSPAAATYGSPTTPGGLETPTMSPNEMFNSPPPGNTHDTSANGVFAAPSQQPRELSTASLQEQSADDLFGAPPQASPSSGPAPASQLEQPPTSARELFGAPPVQQVPSRAESAGDIFGKPAAQEVEPEREQIAELSQFSSNAPNTSANIDGSAPSYGTQVSDQAPAAASFFGTVQNQPLHSSQESPARQPFGGSPSKSNPVSPFAIPPPTNISRAQSADELFGGDAPVISQTTAESSINETSKQLFADPVNTSGSAEDVFGSPPDGSNALAEGNTQEQTLSPSGQNASESNQEHINDVIDGSDGELEEIPLSQSPVRAPRLDIPSTTLVNATQPTTAALPQDNSLFAAIGMPPPPLSSRRF